MQYYLVGGAVRDQLLGVAIHDKDWVVVGACADELIAQGFKPIAHQFPVFLHPQTQEEVALARTEIKIKSGHQGFVFDTSSDVTLQMDLKRRDLTINAIAQDEQGNLYDPYHGVDDLKNKMLRHVTPAFVEDPLRVLRTARFLARYAHLGFSIANETMLLMQAMVASGEIKTINRQRAWLECQKALGEKNPEKFFETLIACGAASLLFPLSHFDQPVLAMLQAVANKTNHVAIRFAVMMAEDVMGCEQAGDIKKAVFNRCEQFNAPNDYRDLSYLLALHYRQVINAKTAPPEQLRQLFDDFCMFKQTMFNASISFDYFLNVCQIMADTRHDHIDISWLKACAKQVNSVNAKEVGLRYQGKSINKQLKQLRLQKICDYQRQMQDACYDVPISQAPASRKI